MDIEHLIGLGVVVVLSLLAAWLVWTCMCKSADDDDDYDVESQQDEEVKSVNSRTKVISTREIYDMHHYSSKEKEAAATTTTTGSTADGTVNQLFIKPKKGSAKASSGYVQTGRERRFHDPFGVWESKDKEFDDTETLSGLKTYRKSPVLPHRS